MNLFLYIPNHSAHTPGLLKSLAYGLISTYKRQNSSQEDFKENVRRLYNRLITRGYEREQLLTLFQDITAKLDSRKNQNLDHNPICKSTKSNGNKHGSSPLFFHLPYHPKGISRRFIQQMYKEKCEKPDDLGESFTELTTELGGRMRIPKLTVAYNRPKNLRDLLSPSTLLELFEDCKVEKFLPTKQSEK